MYFIIFFAYFFYFLNIIRRTDTIEFMFEFLTANSLLLYLIMEESSAIQLNKTLAQKICHIGLPTPGKYKVREDVEKAPKHDHTCNLTWTAVQISLPEEMRSDIFVNLLGYKEPVHLLAGLQESKKEKLR